MRTAQAASASRSFPSLQLLQESFTPRWAAADPVAQHQLQNRIAIHATQGNTITYSDLVSGIPFNILDDRPGYTIDVHAWQDLDRAIIGDFLGALSIESYERHCFLISALVVSKESQTPSENFMRWLAYAYDSDPLEATVIWARHRDRAVDHFQQGA